MMKYHNTVVIDDHQLIAYCIPKIANTSIKIALLQAMGQEFNFPNYRYSYLHRHPKFRFAGPQELSDERYADWYSFAVIRNPWDRLVSCWADKVRDRREGFASFDKWGVTQNTPFSEFVQIVSEVPDDDADWHFQSQASMISWEGRLLPKRIVCMENMAADWKGIQMSAPISLPDLETHGASEHAPYRTYYTPHTRSLVAERYKQDINLLKYVF